MEYCISASIEPDLKKKVDNLRYHYDRNLMREKYPYINILGPIESYSNLKKISSELTRFFKNRKRIRIGTDIMGFLESDRVIFLNVSSDKGSLRNYHDLLLNEFSIEEPPLFFPHISIAKNHTLEELQTIYEELSGFTFQYSFFIESVSIFTKTDKYWEEYVALTI